MMKELIFKQLQNGYRYNSDTLILAHFILALKPSGKLLEVGCGCGIIAAILKEHLPEISLTLIDIQKINYELSLLNFKANKLKAELICEDFLHFQSKEKFDLIFSNPPFYNPSSTLSQNKHKNISKNQDFLPLKDFLTKTNSLLKPQGKLCLCYKADALQELCACLKEKKFHIEKLQFLHSKKEQKARLLLLLASKSSQKTSEILAPFFVYEGKNLSHEMIKINQDIKVKSYD